LRCIEVQKILRKIGKVTELLTVGGYEERLRNNYLGEHETLDLVSS